MRQNGVEAPGGYMFFDNYDTTTAIMQFLDGSQLLSTFRAVTNRSSSHLRNSATPRLLELDIAPPPTSVSSIIIKHTHISK
jgi:hypothetical protein